MGFWQSPFDDARFERDLTRAMLVALIVKDWGIFAALGVLTLCFVWALYQVYARFKMRAPAGGT